MKHEASAFVGSEEGRRQANYHPPNGYLLGATALFVYCLESDVQCIYCILLSYGLSIELGMAGTYGLHMDHFHNVWAG
jgi:hypothetical protein